MDKEETTSINKATSDQDPIYKPISEENPSGKDLRYTSVYDAIKQARSAEDSTLPQGIWKHNVKSSDYKKVASLSYEALCTQSKDLQLAVWLIEAWVVSYGIEGLLQGFNMLEKIIKNFWQTLYPKINKPTDPNMRLAPLRWMNEKLPEKISSYVPLAPIDKNNTTPITLAAYIQEQSVEKKIRQSQNPAQEKEKYKRQKKYTLSDYEQRLENVPVTYYKDLYNNLKTNKETLISIESYINTQLPDSVFSFTKIKKLFRNYEMIIQPYLADLADSNQTSPDTTDEEKKIEPLKETLPTISTEEKTTPIPTQEKKEYPSLPPSVTENLPEITSSIDYRQQAYAQLKKIGDHLLKIDPHSPASYLLQKSIAWSALSLEDIFHELQEQDVDLKEFMSWLGMKKKS